MEEHENPHGLVSFELGGLHFEYDPAKQEKNISKHGISFRAAARVFFDENYLEAIDEEHSIDEIRYDVIGDASAAGGKGMRTVIGNVIQFRGDVRDILYVVYTERTDPHMYRQDEQVIRLISARLANEFERGLYYGYGQI
ncbi:MAG: BrnT family toxin [Lachnospiraceae bacterium]|nr:BrnT family toxin [Lachnospiraceae bacterium]